MYYWRLWPYLMLMDCCNACRGDCEEGGQVRDDCSDSSYGQASGSCSGYGSNVQYDEWGTDSMADTSLLSTNNRDTAHVTAGQLPGDFKEPYPYPSEQSSVLPVHSRKSRGVTHRSTWHFRFQLQQWQNLHPCPRMLFPPKNLWCVWSPQCW